MFHLQQNTRSFWQQTEPPVTLPLDSDRHTEVCVIGGGIVGSLSAYLLLKKGLKVVMIDKEPFGENETSHTSAHLSSVLDEGFAELIRIHGLENARKAYQSHADAISLIERIADEESIDCEFKRVEGFLFSADPKAQDLKQEWEALQKLPFPGVQFLERGPLFSDLGPAISYPDQARFHSGKFMRGLWNAIQRMGGEIYTLTKADEIMGGNKPCVKTSLGYFIYANEICVCTHVPFHQAAAHLKEFAYRSYCVGFEVPQGQFPDALFWDTEDPYHYIRLLPNTSLGHDTVLVGGEDHRVGQEAVSEECFANVEIWARHKLDLTVPVTMKWSGQIIEPADGLAFIGRSPGEEHVYFCSGDSGHGITHGAIAGMIFRDLIEGTPNEWVELYSPSRKTLTRDFFKENTNTVAQYFDWLYLNDELKQSYLTPGEGTLVRHGMKPVAIYCDENNQMHRMSAVCPHLGGVVHWNQAEKTWDCPCHGSRFAATGEVLNGPANQDLSPADARPEDEIQKLSSLYPPSSKEAL